MSRRLAESQSVARSPRCSPELRRARAQLQQMLIDYQAETDLMGVPLRRVRRACKAHDDALEAQTDSQA